MTRTDGPLLQLGSSRAGVVAVRPERSAPQARPGRPTPWPHRRPDRPGEEAGPRTPSARGATTERRGADRARRARGRVKQAPPPPPETRGGGRRHERGVRQPVRVTTHARPPVGPLNVHRRRLSRGASTGAAGRPRTTFTLGLSNPNRRPTARGTPLSGALWNFTLGLSNSNRRPTARGTPLSGVLCVSPVRGFPGRSKCRQT